jgi:DNA-binding GntR family transcriptional regulator
MLTTKTRESKATKARAATDRDDQRPLFAALVAEIEADILDGRLRAGERLEELVLSRKYGVSRTPIREALRQLASAKLVDITPRLGAVVARPTAGEVIELFEVVAELEGVAAALAADRMTDGDRIAIDAAHDASRRSARGDDARNYYRINKVFHRAIHAAAHNDVLADEIETLDKRLAPYRRFITFRPGRTQEALMEHDAIVAALRAQNGPTARAAMVAHVRVLGEDAIHLVKGLSIA